MNIETKSYDFKASVQDEGKGVLHAVVSVFGNEDSTKDVMVKGAFARSIKEGKDKGRLPPGVWAHDWERPVAKTLDAWETDEGLNITAQFNLETKDGQDAYSNIKHELFTEYSFGFGRVRDAEEKKDGVTYVKDVNWFEWSPVLVGANRETRTVGIKRYNADEFESERDLERFLRDAGLPRQAAKKITVGGYKALRQRDVEEVAETAEPEEDAQAPTPEPETPDTSPPSETTEEPEQKEREPITESAPVVVAAISEADRAEVRAIYANILTMQAQKCT